MSEADETGAAGFGEDVVEDAAPGDDEVAEAGDGLSPLPEDVGEVEDAPAFEDVGKKDSGAVEDVGAKEDAGGPEDAGVTEDGRSYIVMEYCPPPDMGKRAASHPSPLPGRL